MIGSAQQHHDTGHFDYTLIDVLERLRNRFFGKYRGVVTDVDASTMRVKASVPAVLGQQPSGWARPCVPFAGPSMGFAFLPEGQDPDDLARSGGRLSGRPPGSRPRRLPLPTRAHVDGARAPSALSPTARAWRSGSR